MDFIDDEADVSDSSILVPSSQVELDSRPRKRQRLDSWEESDQDDYELPSYDRKSDEDDVEDFPEYRSKYEDRTHFPQFEGPQKETFVTQLTQPWSSPGAIRPPRWRKPGVAVGQDSSQTDERVPKSPSPSLLQSQPTRVRPNERPIEQPSPAAVDEFDDDDPDLLEAFMSSQDPIESPLGQHAQPNRLQGTITLPPVSTQTFQNYRQTTLFGNETTATGMSATQGPSARNYPMSNKTEPPTHHSLNVDAMKTWVYPTNLGTIRDYQYNIVSKALYRNLLVALPTGLGKTFIAATVMLNWFRWTKTAQIVFVAPTKPLVAQQIEACLQIAGIPRSDTTMLTGEVPTAVRAEDWQEKRVFFMTPQTFINDLKTGIADPKRIVLIVVDEAHKATGNYAYVEVVRFMRRFNESFRVMGLTATPGASVEAVQKVIDGLDIARTEIRTEESIDIRQYVHMRDIELQTFQYSDEIKEILGLFKQATQPVQNILTRCNAYWTKDPTYNTLFGLKQAMAQWARSEAGRKAPGNVKGPVIAAFRVMMSLAHNIELLKFHGLGPFFHKMKLFEESARSEGKYHQQIADTQHFKEMMQLLKSWINNDDFIGHPKLTYLNEVVLNHFMDAGEGQGAAGGRPPSDTRIMVFAHYRDSAEEIVRILKRHEPMVRPHVFVGQSGTAGSEGMKQSMQTEIIAQFKAGKFNTLVATSIGEEGLDIGEVDLIVCYDTSRSPIRMLQRMGRTGRKRAGKIVVTVMEDKEKRSYEEAKDSYLKMQQKIENGTEFIYHDDRSRRIVPKEIEPVVDKKVVEIPFENTQSINIDPRKRKPKNPKAKKPSKKFHMPDGVETGFTFLGQGKKSKTTATSGRVLDLEHDVVPLLETVLLKQEEQVQLSQNYREVAGTEPQFVHQVNFDAYPGAQRRAGKTKVVPHSRATKLLIATYQRMRSTDQDWTRPTSGTSESVPLSKPPRTGTGMKQRVKQDKAKPVVERPQQIPVSDDDGDDSIVDDMSFQAAGPSDSTPTTSPDVDSMALKLAAPQEEKFWPSQKDVPLDDSEESDLPDLGEVLRKKAHQKLQVPAKSRGRARIVDSDDE